MHQKPGAKAKGHDETRQPSVKRGLRQDKDIVRPRRKAKRHGGKEENGKSVEP